MTRFTDQLFDDLMREHGATLASTRVPPTPKRHLATRPVLMSAGAGGLAIVATVGTLVASGGGTPAYAVTTHPDGTVTLAVYLKTGITEANARLRALGDRVVVVPVESGCPSITSLRAPKVPAHQVSVEASGSGDGSVTVAAQGVPAGDILVLGLTTTTGGQFSMQETTTNSGGQGSGSESSRSASGSSGSGNQSSGSESQPAGNGPRYHAAAATPIAQLTSPPAPSCVSIPAALAGPGSGKAGGGSVTCTSAPSVGHLPPVVQKGGRNPESGAKVSGNCSSGAVTKASSGVTRATSGSASHSGN
jgi:hypothetical protein